MHWCVVTRAVLWKELCRSPKALGLPGQFTYSTPWGRLSSSRGSSLPGGFSGELFGRQSLGVYLQHLAWRSLLPVALPSL